MLEHSYHRQEFPALSVWFPTALQEYPTGGSELSGKVHELLKFLTQSNWVTLDSTGDADEYERESESCICQCSSCLLAMLVCSLTVKVWFEQ